MPGLGCLQGARSHEHTAHPPGEAGLTVLTPRGRNLETHCLSHASKTDVAQARHWVPTLFLCLCEVQNYPIPMGRPLDKVVHVIPHSQLNHRAGVKDITKPLCREGHWENTPTQGELSNKVICQEDGRGMCNFQACREKIIQKKKKRIQQTVGMEGK